MRDGCTPELPNNWVFAFTTLPSLALCKFCLHTGVRLGQASTLSLRVTVNLLHPLCREFSSPPPKQSNPNPVRVQSSHSDEITGPGQSFNLLADGREMRAASDFWLALILVFAAAAFLDFAAMM